MIYILQAPANRTTSMGSIREGANTEFLARAGGSTYFQDIVNTNGMDRFDWILSE